MKLIKILAVLCSLFAFVSTANAAPFAVTAKFTSSVVSKCVFVLNNGTAVEVNPTVVDAGGSTSVCKYDLAGSINGNNVLNVSYKNIWGSSSVVPFSYTKTLPPNPSDITLSEN